MKNYLNQQETFSIAKLVKITSDIEVMTDEWNSRGNLTPEEKKNLKTVITLLIKTWSSIIKRVDNQSVERLYRRGQTMELFFIDKFQEKQLLNRLQEASEKLYSETFYNLVETVMFYNCCNCTKPGSSCKFYEHFFELCVPDPSGEDFPGRQCRYSYEDKARKK